MSVGFRRGEVLLREDDPPRFFYLLIDGTVSLHRRGKQIGTVRGPGGVGFMSFLARNAGGSSAVAESYVEALVIEAEAMEEVFDDHFSVLLGTVRFVAERLIAELEKVLWRAGDPSEHSYFVVKGTLSLRWNEAGRVQELGPGSVTGGAESLVGLPRWNDLVTEEPVVLLRSARDALIDLFEDDQQLALRFLSMLATHLVTI